jgi:hypothetical protein
MSTRIVSHRVPSFIIVFAVLLAACAGDAPLTPTRPPATAAQFASSPRDADNATVVTLRQATARFHDIDRAISEGFVLLHDCESRPGEGPVGTVYVHMGRLTDGKLDPSLPDALIYEPSRDGRLTLVGVEFAVPYVMWPSQEKPTLFGATFQPEDEFGVFALHAWVWRSNPNGLFEETNPRVSCGE